MDPKWNVKFVLSICCCCCCHLVALTNAKAVFEDDDYDYHGLSNFYYLYNSSNKLLNLKCNMTHPNKILKATVTLKGHKSNKYNQIYD